MLAVVSVAMWAMIAVAYKEVTHAYHAEALEIPQSQVLLLMGSSMVGSVIQLPGVGGGSQLATIAALEHIFDVPKELAASCGIMLWLVTFVAVIPAGPAAGPPGTACRCANCPRRVIRKKKSEVVPLRLRLV